MQRIDDAPINQSILMDSVCLEFFAVVLFVTKHWKCIVFFVEPLMASTGKY